MALPPYPAVRNARIDIETLPNQFAEITAQIQNLQYRYGADNAEGILSVTAAGSFSVKTYDPHRQLDPSNPNSPFASYLKPGVRVRMWSGGMIMRIGYIDTIEYDFKSKQGSISGSDAISRLAATRLLPGYDTNPSVPNTLRARADYYMAQANISMPTSIDGPDPFVGKPLDSESSVWTQILTSALDVLYAVWVDRDGVIRFRSFGQPVASGLVIGGAGIAIESVHVQSSMQGIYSRVVSYDMVGQAHDMYEAGSQSRHGDIIFRREHPVHVPWDWSAAILLDRAGAYLSYAPGLLRFQTEAQLGAAAWLGMNDEVILQVNNTNPPLYKTVRFLGAKVEANYDSGWSAELVTYDSTATFTYPPLQTSGARWDMANWDMGIWA